MTEIDTDALRAWNQATMHMGEITKLCDALDRARLDAHTAAWKLEQARLELGASDALLDRITAMHSPNEITQNCMQCGRASPCLTLQALIP